MGVGRSRPSGYDKRIPFATIFRPQGNPPPFEYREHIRGQQFIADRKAEHIALVERNTAFEGVEWYGLFRQKFFEVPRRGENSFADHLVRAMSGNVVVDNANRVVRHADLVKIGKAERQPEARIGFGYRRIRAQLSTEVTRWFLDGQKFMAEVF